MNSKLCVMMQGSTTTAHDSDGLKKSFNFDYSFWSHDGFEVDQNGYSRPTNDKYADQTKVYQLIGSSILVNAWYHFSHLGKAIIAASSLTDKQAQANPTP